MNLIEKYIGEGKYITEEKKKTIYNKGEWTIQSSQADSEGSYIEVLRKGNVVATGDFDRGADTFWIKIGKENYFDEVEDIIKAAKKANLK